jgi:hypothetical protein
MKMFHAVAITSTQCEVEGKENWKNDLSRS